MVKFNFGLGGDDQDSAQGDGTAVPTPAGQDDGATPVVTEPPAVEPVIVDNETPTEAPLKETSANPFADTAPVTEVPVETEAPVITDAPVVEDEAPATEDPAETPNPFSLGNDDAVMVAEEDKAEEIEAPVVADIPLPTPEPKQFESLERKVEQPTKDEPTEPVITSVVLPTTNEEAPEDTKIETPKDEVKPIVFGKEEDKTPVEPPQSLAPSFSEKVEKESSPEEEKPIVLEKEDTTPATSTQDESASKSSKDNPLATLKLVKQEITDYVASHKENIKKYQNDIRDLEKKIQAEKTELSKKRSEFSGLLKDMESLTQDFGSGNGNSGNKPHGNQNRRSDFKK
jgi:hypothetical protein